MRPVYVQRTNIAGEGYEISVTQHRSGYYIARTLALAGDYGKGQTAESAIAHLEGIVDHNHPEALSKLPREAQEHLIDWCKTNLEPGKPGQSKKYNSHYLKKVAERALGNSVGNGEMKGALLKAGFETSKGVDPTHIYWSFTLLRGLPEKIDARDH